MSTHSKKTGNGKTHLNAKVILMVRTKFYPKKAQKVVFAQVVVVNRVFLPHAFWDELIRGGAGRRLTALLSNLGHHSSQYRFKVVPEIFVQKCSCSKAAMNYNRRGVPFEVMMRQGAAWSLRMTVAVGGAMVN
jgi:hypothetical protein